MAYTVGFPIQFSLTGDTVSGALKKGAVDEIAKIYTHVNELITKNRKPLALPLKGKVAAVGNLPATATLGDMYVIAGDPQLLYTWNGSGWIQLQIKTPTLATTTSYGTVTLGTLAGAIGASPSTTKVVNEKVLVDYLTASTQSIPIGAIVLWYGVKSTIPAGWQICDGTNGTPNMTAKFAMGANLVTDIPATGGNASVVLPVSTLKTHTHSASGTVTFAAHTHTIASLNSASTTCAHVHGTGTQPQVLETLGSGAHTHSAVSLGGYDAAWSTSTKIYLGGSTGYITSTVISQTYVDSQPLDAPSHFHDYTLSSFTATAPTQQHTHTVPATAVTSGGSSTTACSAVTSTATSAAASVTKNNLPVYKEMLFIQKVSV